MHPIHTFNNKAVLAHIHNARIPTKDVIEAFLVAIDSLEEKGELEESKQLRFYVQVVFMGGYSSAQWPWLFEMALIMNA